MHPKSLMASLTDEDHISAVTVFQAVRAGDAAAQEVLEKTIHFLAVGLSNLIHLLNPQVIALGGGVAVGGAAQFIDGRAPHGGPRAPKQGVTDPACQVKRR